MRRKYAAPILGAVLLAAVVAGLAAAAPSASRSETGWHVLSANGTVQVEIKGADAEPHEFQQLEASIVGRWQTTSYPNDLTVTFPLQKIRPNIPPSQSFTTLEKLKTSLTGDVKGVYGDPSPGSSQPPKPFSCSRDYKQAPASFLTESAVQLVGGSLSASTMGIGLDSTYPYTAFTGCPAPYGGDLATLISPEQIEWQKAVYKHVPVNLLEKGRSGEKITVVVGLTAPIASREGIPPIGKVVSTATLHLQYSFTG